MSRVHTGRGEQTLCGLSSMFCLSGTVNFHVFPVCVCVWGGGCLLYHNLNKRLGFLDFITEILLKNDLILVC